MAKRKVLLVDDEVPVLLTMKAVLEISGFDVDTATSARDGRIKIRKGEYQMIITDMRMESDAAGREVIHAARTAAYHPAVALLTAFPLDDEEWQDMGADRLLVKPMQTPVLIRQLEKLLETHAAKLQRISFAASGPVTPTTQTTKSGGAKTARAKAAGSKSAESKSAAGKSVQSKSAASKSTGKRLATKRASSAKIPARSAAAKKKASSKS